MPPVLDEFQGLSAFDAIMRHGNLGAGAEHLGISKSTLSRRISHLEYQLGQPLLHRQANRLIPTEAGTLFHQYCQQMLSLGERSQMALDELREEVSGDLSISVHPHFLRGWFNRLLTEFIEEYPGIRLTLTSNLQPPTREDDQVMLWLWEGPTRDSGLRDEVLGHQRQHLYAHPDYLRQHGHPQHPGELSSHDWVNLIDRHHPDLVLHHPEQGEYRVSLPPSRFTVDNVVVHADHIAHGAGIGLLPDHHVRTRSVAHPGQFEACLPEWQGPSIPVSLHYPFGHPPRKLGALLDRIRRHVPKDWGQP